MKEHESADFVALPEPRRSAVEVALDDALHAPPTRSTVPLLEAPDEVMASPDNKGTTSDSPSNLAPAREEQAQSREMAICSELQPRKAQFINVLFALTGNVTLAANHLGISPSTVKHWRGTDAAFEKWVKLARRAAGDLIESALFVSATTGDLEPIYQGGVLVGHKRRKSVQAAEILLAAERPEFRRDRMGEGSTTNNTQFNVSMNLAMTPEEIVRLAEAAATRLFGRSPMPIADDKVPVLD